MKTISSIEEMVKELGGVTKAAEVFGERINVVGNWQLRQKLPANKFLTHQEILKAKGLAAPPSFWFETAPKEGATA